MFLVGFVVILLKLLCPVKCYLKLSVYGRFPTLSLSLYKGAFVNIGRFYIMDQLDSPLFCRSRTIFETISAGE